jgi:hypothetical protein
VAIDVWCQEICDSGYAALKDADEDESEVVQGINRDSGNDDIALPTLANAVEVGGHG